MASLSYKEQLALQQYQANLASASAKNQMAFQERLSNSAHQREIQDLKAAGLNPVLSAGGSGASTPAGAEGDYSGAQVANLLSDVINNNAKLYHDSTKAINAAIEKIKPYADSNTYGGILKELVDADKYGYDTSDKWFLLNQALKMGKDPGYSSVPDINLDDTILGAAFNLGLKAIQTVKGYSGKQNYKWVYDKKKKGYVKLEDGSQPLDQIDNVLNSSGAKKLFYNIAKVSNKIQKVVNTAKFNIRHKSAQQPFKKSLLGKAVNKVASIFKKK